MILFNVIKQANLKKDHQGRKANLNSDVTMIKKTEDQSNTETNLAQPTEEQVIAFLRKNPEFFAHNEYLLSELKIPHASGAAISLGERQVQVFREHRDELKFKLNELISDVLKHYERFLGIVSDEKNQLFTSRNINKRMT